MTKPEILELAASLMAAVQHNDLDRIKAIYAPDITLWHTNDRVNQTAQDSIRTLAWIHKHVAGVRYEEIRVVALAQSERGGRTSGICGAFIEKSRRGDITAAEEHIAARQEVCDFRGLRLRLLDRGWFRGDGGSRWRER